MKQVRFCIHLINNAEINIVECYLDPEDDEEEFPKCFAEGMNTGVLITGNEDTHQFIIPMENILFVERFAPEDDEEEDDEDDEDEASGEDEE